MYDRIACEKAIPQLVDTLQDPPTTYVEMSLAFILHRLYSLLLTLSMLPIVSEPVSSPVIPDLARLFPLSAPTPRPTTSLG